MREVAIIGIGETPVEEQWDKSLRILAGEAILAAMADARRESVDALYVGNMLSGSANHQQQLGALIADWVGLRFSEAIKIESACSSGAAALRAGLIAVGSGALDSAIVVGVEKNERFTRLRNHSSPCFSRRCRLGVRTRPLLCRH